MDFFSDFCADKSREFLTGTFYKRRPLTTADGGISFTYETLDPHSREYKTLISTLLVEGRNTAIKTRSSLDFKIKNFIVTQDAQLWQIVSVLENPQNPATEEALRIFREAPAAEKIIRMVGIENPMSLK